MFVDFNILNQLGSPAINSNTFANRPAAGQTGRLFVSTDTFEIYRDNGTTWDLIGGPGSSTITGTGTATQVAYFTSSQAIGSSANLFWDNTNTRLGIGTATPGAALDIHSTGIIAQFNTTSATGNTYIAFQRTGTGVWRMGDNYSAGNNFFELHNTALATDALQVAAATNKTSWQATQTYTTGLARGNYFDYNLSVSAGGSFSSPNAITALGASLDLTLAGSATIPSGARSGLDAYNSIAFTGAGTLTHNQGTQIRAYSNLTAGWAFNGSATGTVTHLAGLRALFPDNTGSAINVTNNYALLLNDQTPNTGTVTYTNRWGVYQEGASDLNYFASNVLIGTTVNAGNKLEVVGTARINFASTPDGYRNLAITYPSTFATRLTIGASNFYIENDGNPETFTFVNTTGSGIFDWKSGASATQRMRLDGNGNLGLNTVSPNELLSLGFADNASNAIEFRSATYARLAIITGGNNTTSSNGYLAFSTRNGGSINEVMRITTDQRVGISTFSPFSKLDVSIGATEAICVGNSSLTISAGDLIGALSFVSRDSSTFSSGGVANIRSYATTTYNTGNVSSDLRFYVADSLQNISANVLFGTEAMRITSGGNVLIGTTTDAGQKLQVNGTSYLVGNVGFNLSSTTTKIDINCDGGGAGGYTGFRLKYGTSSVQSLVMGQVTAGNGAFIGTSQYVNAGYWQTEGTAASVLNFGVDGAVEFSTNTGLTANTDYNLTSRVKIHNNGGLKLVPQSAAPTAEAGTLYYDSDDNKLKLYDGSNWVDLN